MIILTARTISQQAQNLPGNTEKHVYTSTASELFMVKKEQNESLLTAHAAGVTHFAYVLPKKSPSCQRGRVDPLAMISPIFALIFVNLAAAP